MLSIVLTRHIGSLLPMDGQFSHVVTLEAIYFMWILGFNENLNYAFKCQNYYTKTCWVKKWLPWETILELPLLCTSNHRANPWP